MTELEMQMDRIRVGAFRARAARECNDITLIDLLPLLDFHFAAMQVPRIRTITMRDIDSIASTAPSIAGCRDRTRMNGMDWHVVARCFLSSRFPHLGVRTFFWTNYAVNPSCLRYWIGLIPPSDIFIRSSAYQCI